MDELPGPATDPTLSGSPAPADDEPLVFTANRDPADRWFDRLLAKLDLLDDAAPLFRDGERVPRAGVLLALPAIAQSGIVEIAREVYGSIGPAFYGLRTTMVALVFLALLRIKRPEALPSAHPTGPPRSPHCAPNSMRSRRASPVPGYASAMPSQPRNRSLLPRGRSGGLESPVMRNGRAQVSGAVC